MNHLSFSSFWFLIFLGFVASVLYGQGCDFGQSNSDYRWAQCEDKSNTTFQDCINQGCCFNSTFGENLNISALNCVRRVKRKSDIKNGTCIKYNGNVCKDVFRNSSQPNAPRMFDAKYLVNGTDKILLSFFEIFDRLKFSKEKCKDILKESACPFIMPVCENDDTQLKACREDCEYVYAECESDLERALGVIDYNLLKNGLDFYHVVVPVKGCKEYSPSYEGECMHIYEGIDRSPPKEEKKSKIVIIGGAAGGVTVLIIIIIVALVRRNKNKKKKLMQAEMDYMSNMTSIREHIRSADNSVNPLMELLASSKPGELVQYPVDCIEYVKELGEGQFGKVFQGRVHGVVKGEESTDVAVKCLKEGSSDVAKASFNQEVALMSVFQHNNILRLLAVSTEEEPYCMIFEFMEKGDLNEFLRQWSSKDYLNDSKLIKICKHVASGMEYLATKKFLHRDLATRNCLVGKDLMVKIADFGMSRNVYHSDYYRVGGEAMLPIRWMPPESILYGKFTVASDVYSFGVVMWEIFSFALQPFYGYGNEEVIDFIKKGVLLPKPEDCPEWIYNIMLECWKRDPEERITFTKALQLLKGQVIEEQNYQVPKSATNNLSNYDQVPSTHRPVDESTVVSGYDRVTVSQQQQPPPLDSNYDKVWNSTTETPCEDDGGDEKPSYVNLEYKPKDKQNNMNVERSPITEIPSHSPVEPGSPNMAFDDDEKSLLKTHSTTSLPKPKGSPSLQGRLVSRSPKRSKKRKSKEFQTNEEIYRRRSQGGRSIKDVMKDGPRYVTSDDVKRISQASGGEKSSEDSRNQEDNRGFECAFRPTSEFLPYHGYGENIQANDPDEAKLIKRIIEEGN